MFKFHDSANGRAVGKEQLVWDSKEQRVVPTVENAQLSVEAIQKLRNIARTAPRYAFFEITKDLRANFKPHMSKQHRQAQEDMCAKAWVDLMVAGLHHSGDCAHYSRHVPLDSYKADLQNGIGPLRQLHDYRKVVEAEINAEKIVAEWLSNLTGSEAHNVE